MPITCCWATFLLLCSKEAMVLPMVLPPSTMPVPPSALVGVCPSPSAHMLVLWCCHCLLQFDDWEEATTEQDASLAVYVNHQRQCPPGFFRGDAAQVSKDAHAGNLTLAMPKRAKHVSARSVSGFPTHPSAGLGLAVVLDVVMHTCAPCCL
jgi:hypothetical protein